MKSLAIFLLGGILGAAAAGASLVYQYPSLIQAIARDITVARHLSQHRFDREEGDDYAVIEAAPDTSASPPRKDTGTLLAESPFAKTALPAPLDQTCTLPTPKAGTRTIAVGTYQGRATNTDITFDRAANRSASWLVDVEITAGNDPLWLVMSAFEPVIWNFQGEVDRIEHVVVVDGVSSAGALGLPEGHVTAMGEKCFTETRGPVYFSKVSESWQVLGAVEAAIGEEIDTIFAKYSLDRAVLPKGDLSRTGRSAFGEAPGLHHVDPSGLVLTAAGQRPEILPGPIGIAQLIESGKLRETSGHQSYEILSHMPALPPGVRGDFTLAKDVAPPSKLPFMACVRDWRGKPLEPDRAICP
mgnify:CR=1 FL=1